jgi:hypothetical protein
MTVKLTRSTSTAAPAGAEADCLEPSHLLLLVIIGLLICWAEGIAAALRQRSETRDPTDLMSDFGTTDVALILDRITIALQRLKALEDKINRNAAGRDTDPRLKPVGAAASPFVPSAPRSFGLTPEEIHFLMRRMPVQFRSAPVHATGPPRTAGSARKRRGQFIRFDEGAWSAPSCLFPAGTFREEASSQRPTLRGQSGERASIAARPAKEAFNTAFPENQATGNH